MSVFLTAEWRALLMLNYEMPPEVLEPYMPRGLELDLWEGKALASMVGFLFLRTRVRGIPIPFHQNFEEVNLRFYVKRLVGGEWRRGVIFVKEIVKMPAITAVARVCYNERYETMPMDHEVILKPPGRGRLKFRWKSARGWNELGAEVEGEPAAIEEGSEAEFIFEHYHGYSRQGDGGLVEYEVRHPRWRHWVARDARFECDVEQVYGAEFARALAGPPRSAFVGEGSAVEVLAGKRVEEV